MTVPFAPSPPRAAPSPTWAEVQSLLLEIRSPGLAEILAAIEGAAGDLIAPRTAERIAHAIQALYASGGDQE